MNGYSVDFTRSARRELERLPAQAVERVARAVRRLEIDPRPGSSRKLAGSEATYRI